MSGGDGKKAKRFDEQLKLSGFAQANQDNLASGRVLICGAGAVAQVVALNLLNVGIGSVKIAAADPDVLDCLRTSLRESSSSCQTDFSFQALGQAPLGESSESAALLKDCQIVVDGLTHWQEKLELSDMCMQFRKPLVHAGGGGLRYQLFTMVPGRSACLRCLLAKLDMEDFARARREEGSLYAMESLVGSYLALEVVKLVGKVGASQANELLKIDGLSGEMEVMRGMDRNKDCPDCGDLRAGH